MESIEQYFLDYTQQIERPIPVIYDPNDPKKMIVTEQNIMTIVGEAKSRKSFLASLLTIDYFHQHKDREALYIDTEQGDWHVRNIAHRICGGLAWNVEQVFKAGKFKMANLRRYNYKERLEICEAIIKEFHPSFIVIDHVRDLMESSNDDIGSRMVVDKFMEWTQDYNCSICTIIHTNKDGETPKGHTGADLLEKSETIVLCKSVEGGNTSVKCLRSRNEPFDDFEFYVDENHIPKRAGSRSLDNSAGRTDKEKKAFASLKKVKNVAKHIWIAEIQASVNVCEKTAKDYFTNAVNLGYLVADDREGKFFSHTLADGVLMRQTNTLNDTQIPF